jgi:cysteine desulfurase
MSRVGKKTTVYLDNAASTPVEATVIKEIVKTSELYGNPSSFNERGREARRKMEASRKVISGFLGASPEEVIFTSSGSEANNLAILGLASASISKKEIITTPIEHPSVLEPLNMLKKWGWKITFVAVNGEGLIETDDLKNKLNPGVMLVSVMYANNEIGTIQPIKKIAKLVKDYNLANKAGILLHTDACQTTEYLDMNINNLGVDLMTFNSSKIYGPKGIAVLFKKRGTVLGPIVYGGDQERGLRAGTENLPAITGLAKAVSLINKKEAERLAGLRDYFLKEINNLIPGVKVNGPLGKERLPNNINISVPELSDENLLLELDKYCIYASSGSACTARSVEPSHVLKAIGAGSKYLNGALRFSLGRQTTKKDIDYVLKILPKVVADLKKRYLR